ncbi:MAG: serine hydrolase [bacterium]
MKMLWCLPIIFLGSALTSHAQLTLRPDVAIPKLNDFHPLPAPDSEFTSQIAALVKKAGLDEKTPASQNPDKEDEWSSICVVDISDINHPRVGGWEQENFVYPASSYKLYVLGETIRRVVEGTISLDDVITVKERNVRSGSRLSAGQKVTVSEVLRLMMTYSDNTAANEAIDLVDRQRASALLRAMGLKGSDITRKYLTRTLEDDGYTTVPGTTSSALHFATFLWAVENGAIGGGRGRGLIKGYMAMNQTAPNRIRGGLPDSATLYTKTGSWNTFTSEVAIVEDRGERYIVCILTALPTDKAEPRITVFVRDLHAMLQR